MTTAETTMAKIGTSGTRGEEVCAAAGALVIGHWLGLRYGFRDGSSIIRNAGVWALAPEHRDPPPHCVVIG